MSHDQSPQPGAPAPEFLLRDLNGHPHALSHYHGRVVILNFWSAECEWSERADAALAGWRAEWGGQVEWISIAPNANEGVEQLRAEAEKRGLPLVLHDPEREVTDLYGAEMTPHFFVVDPGGVLQYVGALDDVTFQQTEPTRHLLKEAVDAVLAGKTPEVGSAPAYGCTIVYFSP
ncbi:MAG TPA: redoxin domain-containing protein [Anaerolineales bacterium]|nr:redoxin domain-containing protein [Anaerolineales bacterium]